MNWLRALARHEHDGTACVLVTVLAARGSTPREAGAKMVVTASGQDGSIGGGRLEHASADIARMLLRDPPDAPVTRDFPLGPALGQCCGGHATVLFEPMRPAASIALFGAGHVGHALVRLLGDLPFRVRWVDSRPDAFPDGLPGNVVGVCAAEPEREVESLGADAMVLVMTHDHGLDYRVVAACLRRGDLRFVGLIGSETKRARFASRLLGEGLEPSRLVCPIGLPEVGGKTPAEIAVTVAAQILMIRNGSNVKGKTEGRDPDHRVRVPAGCATCRTEPQ